MIKIKRKDGDKLRFDIKSRCVDLNYHSMSSDQQSLKRKKTFAKKKGFLVRSIKEDGKWSIWTSKSESYIFNE